MSLSKKTLLVLAAAVGIGAASTAVAQFNPWASQGWMRSMTDSWGEPTMVGQLASGEGVYVDMKEFKINKGAAKGDPSAQLKKSGAREVADGAIIYRSGGKLYIVDGKPPAE